MSRLTFLFHAKRDFSLVASLLNNSESQIDSLCIWRKIHITFVCLLLLSSISCTSRFPTASSTPPKDWKVYKFPGSYKYSDRSIAYPPDWSQTPPLQFGSSLVPSNRVHTLDYSYSAWFEIKPYNFTGNWDSDIKIYHEHILGNSGVNKLPYTLIAEGVYEDGVHRGVYLEYEAYDDRPFAKVWQYIVTIIFLIDPNLNTESVEITRLLQSINN